MSEGGTTPIPFFFYPLVLFHKEINYHTYDAKKPCDSPRRKLQNSSLLVSPPDRFRGVSVHDRHL